MQNKSKWRSKLQNQTQKPVLTDQALAPDKIPILRVENLGGRKFCEVKNSRNFRDKLSRMTSNHAFRDYLTFENYYFKW